MKQIMNHTIKITRRSQNVINNIRKISGNKINNQNALAITIQCSNSQYCLLKKSSGIDYFVKQKHFVRKKTCLI